MALADPAEAAPAEPDGAGRPRSGFVAPSRRARGRNGQPGPPAAASGDAAVDGLLDRLRAEGIRIWADGDRLRYHAPAGAIDPALAASLRTLRDAILSRLCRSGGACAPCVPAAPTVSSAQRRMWLAWKLAPLSPAYNVAFAVALDGCADPDSVRAAVQTICMRHAVLRTGFRGTRDGPVPVVHDRAPVVPLVAAPDEAAAARAMEAEAGRPVDLAAGPPFRARLYRVGAGGLRLFVVVHHVAADAASIPLFLEELSLLLAGRGSELPSLSVQYADFAAWERARLAGPERAPLLAHWTAVLAGVPEPLELPESSQRLAAAPGRALRTRFRVPVRMAARLAEAGRAAGATRFMVLAAAFRVLLHRYTGQRDFVIGTPAVNRSLPGTERLIGCFGNTVVLRNALRAGDRWADVLARERDAARGAFAHQELPYEVLTETLAAQHPASQAARFRAMISYASGVPAPGASSAPALDAVEVETGAAKVDLLLSFQHTTAGLEGIFEYPADRYARGTFRRMAAHYLRLLSDLVRHPRGGVARRPLPTRRERKVLLERWSGRDAVVGPAPGCLHAAFEERTRAHPDAPAVRAGDSILSYRSLNAEANRVAHALLARGVRAEEPVAVCLPRTPGLIAALLGILKAGGAYVPVEPAYPGERRRQILRESRARLAVADESTAALLDGAGLDVLRMEALPPRSDDPRVPCTPSQLAYVLFTSGSTGTPKGVMIEHRSAAAVLAWAYRVYGPDDLAGVLAATSVCFDLSVFEIFAPLCAGGAAVLAENALALPRLPARDAVTLVNTVPSVMRALLESDGGVPGSVRVVNLAGEPLPPRLVDDVYRRTAVRKVYDLYGPTEATTYATWKLRAPGTPASIGHPVHGTRVYVVDPGGCPVPIGVVGELFLAGDGLARGYLHRPELTEACFGPPRWRGIPERRLYRTGDRVRFTPSGELEYHGRAGDQVKVRGCRVEPGEVRAALLAAEEVADAAVVGRPGSDGATRLEAFVVAQEGRFSARALRLHLRERLPEYMIPACFVRVDALPRNASGKLDVARLHPAPSEPAPSGARRGPATPTERRILAIWRRILQADHASAQDDFFDLGGHSLNGMRITAAVGEAFGIDLPLQTLLQHSTVAALAAVVDARVGGTRTDVPLPALRRRPGTVSPATLVQQHLWSVHHSVPSSEFLNLSTVLNLRGPLDAGALRRSVAVLADRHPILRARFGWSRGALWQLAPEGAAPELVLLDPAAGPGAGATAEEALQAAVARPFDLARGPCARFVASPAGGRHLVALVVHHIAADEWSLQLLARELAACCRRTARGLAEPTLAPGLTFGDYAWWERQCLDDGSFSRQLAYWGEALRPPLAPLRFRWRPGGAEGAERLETLGFEVPAPLVAGLARLARRERTSLFVALLSTLKRLIAREAGTADVRVATNVAVRHQAGAEAIVGPLTDTLVLRTDLSGDPAPLAAVRRVRASFQAACGHNELPFEEMARRLGEAGVARRDLAQTFFALHDGEAEPDATRRAQPGGTGDAEAAYFQSAPHDYALILYLRRTSRRLTGHLTLKGSRAAPAVASEVVNAYLALLEDLCRSAPGRSSLAGAGYRAPPARRSREELH